MKQEKKKLPIGYEFFDELREKDFYYVDKTGLVKDLLSCQAKVMLFTRPRRFGKTLNMSMIANFFSVDGDKSIFDGLMIAKETDICEKYMGKYPVIFLTLKNIDAMDYGTAFRMAARTIMDVANKAYYLLDSDRLTEHDKKDYLSLLDPAMAEDVLEGSLRLLCSLLEKHYGRKVVLLIDEYDVPLAKANENGYYDQMVSLIRGLLGAALKTNEGLEFAVLTGCLRIAKESIFTGLNGLAIFSISDKLFSEYFGFTDDEVRELLAYYGMDDCYEDIQNWYDGYHFGNAKLYCPWDVVNHCLRLRNDPNARPENYWINTSGNDAVRRLIEKSGDATTRREIERLVAGDSIEKEIREELTYQDIYETIDNLWSLLYATGYLTQRGEPNGRRKKLAIPNMEVRDVFETQIMDFFKKNVKKDGATLGKILDALENGEPAVVEQVFTGYLKRTISIRDTGARKEEKESFYHGLLLGILGARENWAVMSNRESGDGYADILAEIDDGEKGIVIEVKYARDGDLDGACQDALRQIKQTKYDEILKEDDVEHILRYGIACYKKKCRVMMADGE